ncbi:TetR/AcrR family transcriptional regulator [Listeria costaricensis]|uniref:TetR/AcrR family transcriptional regulator n=1 Tax=Listeria costaricensis TaxID=2026604 RepID=UPI000C06D2CB|nr:TetR/AcrR family transcriptional regulator [Listeria costaricensis]
MSKNKLKEAALTLFAEKGYEGTALSEIAKAVGIKTPSIYAHFASKEELFLEIFRDTIQTELKSFHEASEEEHESSVALLKAIFYKATDFEREPEAKKFFQRAVYYPPKALESRMMEETKNYEELSFDLLGGILSEQLTDKGSRDRWLHVFYAFLDGLSVEHTIYTPDEFEKRRHSAWETLAILYQNERSL